ncbi:hypothetical protein N431DRAFT_441249 [Stipitochalara longipes BDJ]|nr:hypothetical protein N431DRAFT_441249 [Stipitochalara longipes BDJ]
MNPFQRPGMQGPGFPRPPPRMNGRPPRPSINGFPTGPSMNGRPPRPRMNDFLPGPGMNGFPPGPDMNGPSGPQDGMEQMSLGEALQRSGLDDGNRRTKIEWLIVMRRAERLGLVQKVGSNMYLIGPEFWQQVEMEFGRGDGGGGGGGGGGFEDEYDEGQGYQGGPQGFPTGLQGYPGARPRPEFY